MDIQKRLQELEAVKNQATQEAVMQENMLQGARQKVAEIQGRINELLLVQKDLPVEEEEAEEEENNPPVEVKKRGKYKKRQEKAKREYKFKTGKKLFPLPVDNYIEKVWGKHTDIELRELIGKKFGVWFTVDQIRSHRKKMGWIADHPGHKTTKDSVDEMADDLDED